MVSLYRLHGAVGAALTLLRARALAPPGVTPTAVALSRQLPRVDLYTGLYVPALRVSREHVVPKSIMKKAGVPSAGLWDVVNLYCVDAGINSRRSNYKFEDSKHQHMIFDAKHRIFVPPLPARGAVARTVYNTMNKYPELFPWIDAHVIDAAVMSRWMSYPTCAAEILHNEFTRHAGATRRRSRQQ